MTMQISSPQTLSTSQIMKTAKDLEKALVTVLVKDMFESIESTDMGHEAKQFQSLWIEALADKADKGFGIAEKFIYPYLKRKVGNNEPIEGMEALPNKSMVAPDTFNHLLMQQGKSL